MRLLFLGSPKEAVPFLEACARKHEVAAVLTQPDKPSGRGLKLSPPPVKSAAERLGLKVLQPADPCREAEALKALGADLAVVVAYGRLLKPEVLSAARHGFLNVHFSLLPRWRGAAPVAWTLLKGERRAGVTLFWLDQGLDTGPLQRQAEEAVLDDDDEPTLMGRLIDLGVRELEAALGDIAGGRVRREPQAGEPTRAPKLQPSLARLDFSLDAAEFHDRVRALQGGPKPYLPLKVPGRSQPLRVVVLKTLLEPGEDGFGGGGEILRVERSKGILLRLGSGRLWVSQVQPEGKKPVSAADFLNGLRMAPGGRLETLP